MYNFDRTIKIHTNNEEEKMEIGKNIHNQLAGNQDYIDCNIILNIDEPRTVLIWISKDCKEVPKLKF